ncbi:hypothetical protein [Synechococcus sp. MIT S9504]|uniref:hypothetical protein n=1 Tax=Synechococcus sp. MIT S9504 TaxID=1801628 RepID=UPI0007BC0DDF|nr:hypothetical protein [Synechococcus sp. MIT S9504]KZR84534.1 hypothetical protein MITS9504_02895 [Synechococcus sp. MIT S9504]
MDLQLDPGQRAAGHNGVFYLKGGKMLQMKALTGHHISAIQVKADLSDLRSQKISDLCQIRHRVERLMPPRTSPLRS